MRVGGAAIIDRHAEKAGGSECFRPRLDLFQMPAERFLASVDAKHGLESRRLHPLRRFQSLAMNRVQRLCSKPPFIGQLKDPPPLQRRKLLDLPHNPPPILPREPQQCGRGPSEDLGELKGEKRPLLLAANPMRNRTFPKAFRQFLKRAPMTERLSSDVTQREAVEQQPHREELKQRVGFHRERHAIRPCLHLPQQPCPAAKRHERSRQVFVPTSSRHSQVAQRLQHRLAWGDARLAPARQVSGKPAQPGIGRTARRSVQIEKRLPEATVAMRNRPPRHPLIRERRAKADQQRIGQIVAVLARFIEQQIAEPRMIGRLDRQRHFADRLAANPPQQLQRQTFPLRIPPPFDRRVAQPFE